MERPVEVSEKTPVDTGATPTEQPEPMNRTAAAVSGCPQVNALEMSVLYHENLRNLVGLFHADPHFDVLLTGEGFNSLPCGVLNQEELPAPQQEALYVHKPSVVLPHSAHGSSDYKSLLVFYAEDGEQVGTCKLWMSSRTNTLIQKNDYGIPLQEATEVQMDRNGMPKFFLNAGALRKMFHDAFSWNLILLKGDASSGSTSLGSPDDVYCLKKSLAFHCPSFPEDAERALYRRRNSGWPTQALVQRAAERGCHVVGTANDDNPHWRFRFSEAAKCLFDDLSFLKRQAFSVVSAKLSQFKEWHCGFTCHHLRCLFLWGLERMSKQSFESDDVTELVTRVLEELLEFLQEKRLPDFFLPDLNLLLGIELRVVDNLQMKLCEYLLNQPIEQAATASEPKDLSNVTKVESLVKQDSLVHLFEQNVHMSVLQLHMRLYNCATVDRSIAKHKAILRELDNHPPTGHFGKDSTSAVSQFRKAVTSSLGSIYFAKAFEAYYAREKRLFLQKAEDCLLDGIDMDCTQGTIRLANYYVKTKKTEKAVALLSTMVTGKEDQPPDRTNSSDLSDALWQKWSSGQYAFDVMVSELEKPTQVASVQQNIRIANSQMLGLLKCPVAVFSPTFQAQYLYVLSCIELGCTNLTPARTIMEEMEFAAQQKEVSNLNERRNLVHCNQLAHLYLLLKERDKAVSLLKKSIKMMSNPRNPASVTLFSLRTEWIRRLFMKSATVVVVAGLAVVMFKLRY